MMHKHKTGIVAFSFGLRTAQEEPNPCNRRLALQVQKFVSARRCDYVICAQWEIGRALTLLGIEADCTIDATPGTYLNSEAVVAVSIAHLKRQGVREVIAVANPFLHLRKCRRLLKCVGFRVRVEKIDHIGFDPQSTQWYTRNRYALCLYALLQLLVGYRGTSN